MNTILVIDQGTHASRCIVFDAAGNIIGQSAHPLSIYRQGQHFIEQNPEKILASIYYCIDNLHQKGLLEQVTSAALVTQRSTIVAWDKYTGKAISQAISWLDTRTSKSLQSLKSSENEIKNITGLPLSPHYGGSKIKWLIENDEKCKPAYLKQSVIIAPLACYLIEQLTGDLSPVVDHVNASRTQLLDIKKLTWSKTMLSKFGIDTSCLPALKPCLSDYGKLRHHEFSLELSCGDQNAALFANGNPPANAIIINIGTGAFALKVTNNLEHSKSLLSGLAVTRDKNNIFVQEGTVNGAGAAINPLFNEIDEEQLFEQLPAWLKQIKHPPVYINSVGGLGSPWWNTKIQDRFIDGNADDFSLPARAVAIIESIVFLLQNNIEQIKDDSKQQIIISGGLSSLDGLCQKLADLSKLEVNRFDNTEASAAGAAWLLSNPDNWNTRTASAHYQPEVNGALQQRYLTFTHQLTSLSDESFNKDAANT